MKSKPIGSFALGFLIVGQFVTAIGCSNGDCASTNPDCGTGGSSSSSSSTSGTTMCTSGDIGECYSGPSGTLGVGECAGGTQTCNDGVWSTCNNEKVPSAEVCDDGLDNDCNGMVDDGCSPPPPSCPGAANIWHFGANAGLDFATGTAVPILGPISTEEGSATISDCQGNILVTSDGSTAYDSNGAAMPNGIGLGGGSSSLQSALLLAEPGSNNSVVHLFTVTPAEGNLGPLHHTRIDMTANGGLGDVDPAVKAEDLSPSVIITERLIAVKHANKIDDWVIVHEMGTDMFQAYRLTSGQISAPVESHTGTPATGGWDFYGALAASKDGKQLATVYYSSAIAEIYDFDNATGAVSRRLSFSDPAGGYGVEISPNGKYLFVTCYGGGCIHQYDLTLPEDQIASNMASIGTSNTQVKRGPDGRIYLGVNNDSYVGVIPDPDNFPATFNPTAIELLPGTSMLEGLPNVPHGLY